jgi:two-component system, chemotaxis family, chemotaxis protein CheY
MPIRVLVVDDYQPFRVILRYVIGEESDIEIVGEAADGFAAVDLAHDLRPDVVLLDLAMPKLDGWEAIPGIRAVSPGSRIVILSGFPEERMRDLAHEHGIAAYVEKGDSEDAIRRAVRDAVAVAR